MEQDTEQRLRHIIREALGGGDGEGLGSVTGPAAEQEGEHDEAPVGPSKRRDTRRLESHVMDALGASDVLNSALNRFMGVARNVIKRELAGKVPGLSREAVDHALQIESDFEATLAFGIIGEVTTALLEELPPAS